MIKKIVSCFIASAIASSMLVPVMAADEKSLVFDADFDSANTKIELKGGAEITDEGKNGTKGLHLNGKDGYALLPKNLISGEMTVSAWVKQDKKNTWGRLFDLGTDSNNNFFFAPSSGGASRVEAKSSAGADTMDADEFEATGVWAYYTVAADNNGYKLYRNGRLISEKRGAAVALSDIKNELNYIGKSHYEGDAYFSGTIDDFKVYNRVLSQEEIIKDMEVNISKEDLQELLNSYAPNIKDGELVLADEVSLPKISGIGDAHISVTSSEPQIINDKTGKVTPGDENTEVTLTVSGSWGDDTISSVKKEYTVTVPSRNKAPFTVNIDASDRSKDISDNMWGLFFEDINSAADGGLYAELVQNGSFEYTDNLYSWETSGDVEVKTDTPIHKNNPSYIEMPAGSSITNDGYMGLNIKKGEKYTFSAYIYGKALRERNIKIQLLNENNTVIGEGTIQSSADETSEQTNDAQWKMYETVIDASGNAENAKLSIVTDYDEVMDMISLMPQDTYKGHGLRKDFCEALEEIHPKFLRFPGGCAVEGRTMDLAYNWKDTVGEKAVRKQMENIWNTGEEPYIMSYGLGFYEYFQLCEDMGMEPVPILNCGIACQVRSGSSKEEKYLVPMNKLQPYIQDALDLIEFANGTDMNNEWVKLRADMGHSEPFGMKYIGIGNEQWGEEYFERYGAFAKAIREAYPDMEINLVTTSGPASSGDGNDLAWNWVNENKQYADVLDEHYYENPDWFREHAYRYDTYRRDSAKVFLGEYASKGNTWYNALSEAAFMTGLERNADAVRMASYAPMFAKYGNTQWTAANMIWFNNSDFVLTPNYYVQKLFGTNSGDFSLDTVTTLNGRKENKFTGGIALGAWNSQVQYKDLKITSPDGTSLYNGDFNDWENGGGTWTVNEDGSVNQSDIAEKCILYLNGDYSDYTLTVKAKKLSGLEGFQIGFAGEDYKNYYRVNIGGWSNTKTKLQKINDGTADLVANVAEGNRNSDVRVKENEWQEIRVEVIGNSVKAYLDGVLACEYVKPESYGPVYASSVYDAENDEVTVKLVNTADGDVKVNVKVDNVGYVDNNADVTVMSAESDAVNTLENKNNVVPSDTTISNAGKDFEYTAAARSLNVIKLKTKSLVLTQPGLACYYDNNGNKHEIIMNYNDSGVLEGVSVK